MKQFLTTPAAGKRLIGRALSSSEVIKEAIQKRTLVIVAGYYQWIRGRGDPIIH